MGGQSLNAPIVGIAPSSDGHGYWLAAADGGVFAFGDAPFYGSFGGQSLKYPVAQIAADPAGGGFWLLPVTSLPIATLGPWTGIEPSVMQFSGDSGNIVSSIDWATWNSQSAVGEGEWGQNNCIPDCAGGTVTNYPARITLSAPSAGRFTRLTEAQSGPYGYTFTYSLPNPNFNASP
jgi:hypothetical protein